MAGAVFRLEWRRLVLENPYCRITLSVDHPVHNILNVHPFQRGYVPLANGEPRYEMRTMGITVDATFSRLRAQSREAAKYREWASRISSRLRDWFAPGDNAHAPNPTPQLGGEAGQPAP